MSEQFAVATATPIWAEYPTLARACEGSGLTVVQANSARLAGEGFTSGQIGRVLGIEYDAARNTCRKTAGKLQARFRLRNRSEVYWREVLRCHRNRREKGRSPATLTGIMVRKLDWVENPTIGFQEWKKRRTDPANHTEVSMRGEVVSPDDFTGGGVLGRTDPAELLAYLSEYLSAHPDVVAAACA